MKRRQFKSIGIVLSIALLLEFLSLYHLLPVTAAPIQHTFYASPSGSGTTCSLPAPCSLEGARDKVRTVNANMTGDIEVLLLQGTYNLTSPLEFTESDTLHDSGTNGFNIIYTAAPGEKVTISGGQNIAGWTLYDQNRHIYQARVNGSLQTRQLYVNGVRAIRATSITGLGGTITKTATGYTTSDPLLQSWINPGDIEFVYTGGTGHSMGYWQWSEPRCGVSAITGGVATEITMKQPCWNYARDGVGGISNPTRIENAYEVLDRAGEWYLDRTGSVDNSGLPTLYYKPRYGEDLATAQVTVPVAEALIRATGSPGHPISNLHFKNLIFAYATWLKPNGGEGFVEGQSNWTGCEPGECSLNNGYSAMIDGNIVFDRAHNIRIERNLFIHLGGAGLEFKGGSQHNVVIGNEFTDISGNNIQMGTFVAAATSPDDQESDNQILNNYVHDTVTEYQGGVGILVGFASNTIVSHNEVINTPYTGISVGWHNSTRTATYQGNNQVTYNYVSRAMQGELRDGGLLYLNGINLDTPRSLVAGNWLHDIQNGTNLYVDDVSSNLDINDNVISAGYVPLIVQTSPSQLAKNNALQYNYFSTGAPNTNTADNVFGNNVNVSDGNWNAEAQLIMEHAGLEPAYRDIKSALDRTGWTTSTVPVGGAAAILDGDRETGYTLGSTQVNGMQLTVDMQARKAISGISLFTSNNEFPLAFQLYVSEDGLNFGQPIAISTDYTGYQAANTIRLTFKPVHAQYIKMVQTGSGNRPWSIEEFEVLSVKEMEPLEKPANLAAGKPTTASDVWFNDSNYAAAKATDGNPDTRWAASDNVSAATIDIDFGQNTTFNEVEIQEYGSRVTDFDIQYWNGTTWVNAYTGTTIESAFSAEFSSVTGSKFRLNIRSATGGPSIYEIRIFNTLPPETQVNLAAGKPTTASDVWFNDSNYAAAKATDGNPDTRWAASDNVSAATIDIDFGQNMTFNKVEIQEYSSWITDFDIQYWNGTTWANAHTGTTIGSSFYVDFPDVTGSKFRLNIRSATGGPSIYEIRIFNT